MRKLLAFAASLLISLNAFGEPPGPDKKGERYAEPAGSFFGNWHVCTADDTGYVAGNSPGGSTPLCIPFGSQTIFWANGGNFDVMWSQTASITFDNASIGADSCDVADANGADGVGACFAVMSGLPWNEVPRVEVLEKTTIARRTGVCSLPRKPWPDSNDEVYLPCYATSECTGSLGAGSGATCDTTNGTGQQKLIRDRGCAMVVFQCDTDGALLYIGTQQ